MKALNKCRYCILYDYEKRICDVTNTKKRKNAYCNTTLTKIKNFVYKNYYKEVNNVYKERFKRIVQDLGRKKRLRMELERY